MLALSEATDGGAIEYEMSSGADIPNVGREATRDDFPAALSSSLERMWWPNSGNGGWIAEVAPIASAATSCVGVRRAGYRATAARTAVARSTP